MNLSFMPRFAVTLLGLGLAWFGSAFEVHAEPPRNPYITVNTRGFGVTLAQQQYFREQEVAHSASHPARSIPSRAQVYPGNSQIVTVIGPDGNARSFEVEGVIIVNPPRQTSPQYGVNR